MAERVETTDQERKKVIQRDMEEIKKRYETVNEKLWSLQTRMDTLSRDQAESSCAIQSKLYALLRNSIAQDRTVSERMANQPGPRGDFAKPHRKKHEPTPLPQVHNITESETVKSSTKGST